MTRKSRLLGAASGFALVLAPTMVQAAPVGVAADTTITNTVRVDYNIGANPQTQITATDSFKVDRKIDVVVATTDSAAISVSPGETNAVTTFTVTNNSNETIDFLLTAANQNGGSAQFSGNDVFDATNIRIYVETNSQAGWQTTDAQVSSLSDIASGDFATVYVVSAMIVTPGSPPVLPTNGQISTVVLTATAASGVTPVSVGSVAGTGGTALAASTGANGKMTVETVFTDAAHAPSGDAANNGRHAARSDYIIHSALLSVAKYSRVVSDPVGSSSPRAIPGAVVEYCIVVSNASGGATANDVNVWDVLPPGLNFNSGSVSINSDFEVATTSCINGSDDGTDSHWATADRIVSNIFTSIPENETRTLRFRATIDASPQ